MAIVGKRMGVISTLEGVDLNACVGNDDNNEEFKFS